MRNNVVLSAMTIFNISMKLILEVSRNVNSHEYDKKNRQKVIVLRI